MESSNHSWIMLAGLVALVAIVSLVALATPQQQPLLPNAGIVGMATGSPALLEAVEQDKAPECPGGETVEADGTRWCCRDVGGERVCEQLGVPVAGDACSTTGATAWRNTVRFRKAVCTSATCTGTTSTEYLAHLQTLHQRLVCRGNRWSVDGTCELTRTGSCVADGEARRCQSNLCGVQVTWFAQPMKIVYQDQPPRGEACRDLPKAAIGAIERASLARPVNGEDPSVAAAELLPRCTAAK